MNINHRSGEGGVRLQVEELVVNWHLTEACNYGCQYCYSTWAKQECSAELHRDPQAIVQVLEELYRFFRPQNPSNPLSAALDWKHLRLSIAGGEPTLLKDRLDFVINTARNIGFRVSLITNASLLDHARVQMIAPQLSCLGISLDSAHLMTNQLIGRSDRFGGGKAVNGTQDLIRTARAANPSISIKINTVVNAINADEDMTPVIKLLEPNKWKVLRVLPVHSPALAVTDEQFRRFVLRHQKMLSVMAVEDNADMLQSYLMIDPLGRFFQNAQGQTGYTYSRPIHQVGAEAAFAETGFSIGKFARRYTSEQLAEVG